MEMSNLLYASLFSSAPRAHRPPPSPLRCPGLASALMGIAEGVWCRPHWGRQEMHAPFPGRSPIPGKRTRDGGSRPVGVRKRNLSAPGPQGFSLAPDRSTASGGPNFLRLQATAAPQPTRLGPLLSAAGSRRNRPRGGAGREGRGEGRG